MTLRDQLRMHKGTFSNWPAADALGLVPHWTKDQAIGNKMINALRDSGEGRLSPLQKEKPLPSLAAVPDRN